MNRRILLGRLLLCVAVLACGSSLRFATAAGAGKPGYAGRFRQHHPDSQKIGQGSVVLVAPSWALTAGHVVGFKLKNPKGGKSEVLFKGGDVVRVVTKIYKAPGVDVALLKLAHPVGRKTAVPAACMAPGFVAKDGKISFTSVARSGVHRGRSGKGTGASFSQYADKNGKRPGKAGDSGGGWVVERQGAPDVVFAVIHGGGRGSQVGPLKVWMDHKVDGTKEKISWVSKATVRKQVDSKRTRSR